HNSDSKKKSALLTHHPLSGCNGRHDETMSVRVSSVHPSGVFTRSTISCPLGSRHARKNSASGGFDSQFGSPPEPPELSAPPLASVPPAAVPPEDGADPAVAGLPPSFG